MISLSAFLTILGMAAITYSTRLLGFFLLRRKEFSPKMARMMEAAPGCVLLSVIAPHFSYNDWPHNLAILITVCAAWRLNMIATVLIAVSSLAFLNWAFQ